MVWDGTGWYQPGVRLYLMVPDGTGCISNPHMCNMTCHMTILGTKRSYWHQVGNF